MFKLIKKLFQRKLDRLVQEKQGLEIKKQRIKDKTKTKNSVLETKIDKLTAKTWDNKQVENKLVKEIDRKLDKIARDIDSEKIYANQVADEETKDYLKKGGGLVRIDIEDTIGLDVRIPSGNETGANDLWIPGGYTSGGVPEAVTNTIPLDNTQITKLNFN